MKTILFSACIAIMALASNAAAQTPQSRFEALTKEFLAGYFKASPITATQTGVHEYDSLLDDISPLAQEIEAKRLQSFKGRLKQIDVKKLSPSSSIDYRMLGEAIDEGLFGINDLSEYEWNPLNYTRDIGNAIASLVYQEFAPLDVRMNAVAGRLRRIPHYLEQAKALLKNPPRMHVETAVGQNQGNISMIKDDVLKFADGTRPGLQEEVKQASDTAIAALEAFGKWLDTDVKPNANRDTRIGKAMFEKKLAFALKSKFTSAQVLKLAESELKRVHGEMYKLALPLYKEYYNEAPKDKDQTNVIRMVLEKVVLDHPKKEELMDTVKSIIAGLQRFVAEKDLVTLDPSQPLVIRETPEYERGVAVASMEAPGPLEKNMKSFFNVTPIPNDWTPDQVESYLREYNSWGLRDLCMHEGIPGHYVQLYYANRNPSIVKSVFASGSMVEGWAVFAERFTTDAGYMNGDPRMKLINMKVYLRVITNAIIDNKIHAGTMTQDEAMALMTKEGFQQEREAAGKWRRANLSSAQLSTYFVGFQEIWNLHEAYKKTMGKKYSLKQFNETFLSFGSAPVKYIRESMLTK